MRPDPAAHRRVNQIFQHHAAAIRPYLCRRGVMPADADDVLQRVFIALTRRLGDVRPEEERAFLFGIAAHEASHQRRSYARRRECCDDTITASTAPSVRPDELLRRKAALELIATLLEQLEGPLRQIVELVDIQGFTLGDAASRLRVPVGTAKTRLRRARRALEALGEPHR